MKKFIIIVLAIIFHINTLGLQISAYDINKDIENSRDNYSFNEKSTISDEFTVYVDFTTLSPGDTITIYENENERIEIEYINFTPDKTTKGTQQGTGAWSAGAIPAGTHEIKPKYSNSTTSMSFFVTVKATISDTTGKYSYKFSNLHGFTLKNFIDEYEYLYPITTEYVVGYDFGGSTGPAISEYMYTGRFYAEFNSTGNMRVKWKYPTL